MHSSLFKKNVQTEIVHSSRRIIGDILNGIAEEVF